jgi:hypothetical protein
MNFRGHGLSERANVDEAHRPTGRRDPLHELDRLILEDEMLHRRFKTTMRNRALQTMAGLIVLVSLSGALANAVFEGDTAPPVETARFESAWLGVVGFVPTP